MNSNTHNQINWTLTATRLPGRLVSEDAAALLGFKAHDIPALVYAGLLKPLGGGPRNCVKYFATRTILALAEDERWLAKASLAVLRGKLNRTRESIFSRLKVDSTQDTLKEAS